MELELELEVEVEVEVEVEGASEDRSTCRRLRCHRGHGITEMAWLDEIERSSLPRCIWRTLCQLGSRAISTRIRKWPCGVWSTRVASPRTVGTSRPIRFVLDSHLLHTYTHTQSSPRCHPVVT